MSDKLKIWDKTALLYDVTQGVITLVSKNTITIIDEHGFDIEIDKTRVVKIDIEAKEFT